MSFMNLDREYKNQVTLVIFTLYPPKLVYYKPNHCSINQFLTNFALFSLFTSFWPRRCICKKVALGITQRLCRKQVGLTVMPIERTLEWTAVIFHYLTTHYSLLYTVFSLAYLASFLMNHYTFIITYTVIVTDASATPQHRTGKHSNFFFDSYYILIHVLEFQMHSIHIHSHYNKPHMINNGENISKISCLI